MRALVLEDWWTLAVREIPDPMPGHTDVLLRVLATGICGSDIHGYTGETGRRHLGQVMGHETVGRIVSLGRGADPVLGLRVGDIATVNPVLACGQCGYCAGGHEQVCPGSTVIGVSPARPAAFADLLVAPAANVVGLPAGMPVEYGALVEPLAVGLHAVRRGRVRQGDRVLVVGGGPIGQACALAALRDGAGTVVVSDPLPQRRELAGALGAIAVDPAAMAKVAGEPDLVVDAVGSVRSLRDCFACAPAGATIVLVGMAAPTLDMDGYELTTKERTVVGSFCYTAAQFRETAHWVGTAPAVLAHLVDGRVDLDGAPAAFAGLARGTVHASKVLVLP